MPKLSAEHLRVADVMARDVEFIEPQSSVQAAAVLMGEIEVGALPVGSADQLVGIVTDRDLLYRVVARGRDPTSVAVQEVASRPVLSCDPGDSLRAALDIMGSNYVRRLPVVDGTRKVVGWLTLADISRHLLVSDDALQVSLQALTEGATDV
ncbi:CBS domain-containing protein [Methylobacterium sp. UNC300MFChir4.1]|jgi:CBS domain-containing protein|uniref:CBS domain-containing protein n=1 Tax=Methylobacterium sp. UNC300MFChir4.1 TaxID=1502747 RepID=UPI0008B4C873|nr:CBS domain-containing protein [Methylobacterium sp. UNC300MFChir4.1]SEP34918.1 CBS domain-containing protein [Methylobacterium sp. UNC300MFChir4.1]